MNDERSVESCRSVRVSPAAAEQHLLAGHQPAGAHRVHVHAVDVRAAGAVGVGRRRVRHRAEPGLAGARRRPARRSGARCRSARRPCPGGAARRPRPTRTTGAACAAKRIISTAPTAKFGATTTPTAGASASHDPTWASRSGDMPLVPTTTWMPCSTQNRTLSITASGRVRSTATWAPGVGQRAAARRRSRGARPGRGPRPPRRAAVAAAPIRPYAPRTPTWTAMA